MEHQYNQRLEKIEAVLRAWLPENPNYDHKNWIETVFAPLPAPAGPEQLRALTLPARDLLDRGGKRWRPLLMTLVCENLGAGDAALPLTPLVEFPHTASLIHDDIEDRSETRRGEPAAHIRYGTDTALNSGAFLYFLPLSCIEGWDAPPERRLRAFRFWTRYIRRLHLGQSMDIAWHRDFAAFPSVEAYYAMCRLKTGSLAALAAALGVLAAGKTESGEDGKNVSENEGTVINSFTETAETLGMGFQILDDVKNLTAGNPGKQQGDDVVEGKKSLPVLLYASRRGREERKAFLRRCFSAAREGGTGVPEVGRLIAELSRDGAIAEAEALGRGYVAGSRDFFARQARGNLLAGLVDFIGGGFPEPQGAGHA
ncbi:MAG: polyprenyl synthetase family protein [Spirochaetaceae bacterium]|jgi:octaprenyl-diphosphate synthase|nr:polyprenyl synthetase family protein [Spirochaetaceae bacterium]